MNARSLSLDQEPVLDPEPYLEHLEWVRGLAQRLVGDPAEADDLRQEVWLVAERIRAERGAPTEAGMRGWLDRILRNVIRNRRRASRVRSTHEAAAAQIRSSRESEETLVLEVEAQSRVVDLLLELKDPYRSVLLKRYYDDLTPMEIAAETGVALPTVKTQLRRGLEQLRSRAADDRRNGVSTVAALAFCKWRAFPMLFEHGPGVAIPAKPARGLKPSSTQSTMRMMAATGGTAGAAALLVVALQGNFEPEGPIQGSELFTGDPAAMDLVETAMVESEGREAVEVVEDVVTGASIPARGPSLEIEVVDSAGRPVPGAEVQLVGLLSRTVISRSEWLQAGADGRLAVDTPTHSAAITARVEGYVPIALPDYHPDAPGAIHSVIVERAIRVHGCVTDAQGRPVVSAQVRAMVDPQLDARLGRSLGGHAVPERRTLTDANGRYEFDAPSELGGVKLAVSCPGFVPDRQPLDLPLPGEEFAIEHNSVLEELPQGAMFGVITDAEGEPLQYAYASNGTEVVSTDALGRFVFEEALTAPAELVFGSAGRAPKRVETPASWPVEVSLDEPLLGLQGRVVDGRGEPLSGAWVTLSDMSPAGRYKFRHRGRPVASWLAVESFGNDASRSVPSFLGEAIPCCVGLTTDETGEFSLVGLEARPYTIEIRSKETVERRLFEARMPVDLAQGTAELELVFDPAPTPAVVEVMDPDGNLLPGVGIQSFLPLVDGAGDFDPESFFRDSECMPGPALRTDGSGKATFVSLPPSSVIIAEPEFPWIHGGLQRPSDPDALEETIRIEVVAAARLNLELSIDSGPFDEGEVPRAIGFRAASGAPVYFAMEDLSGQPRLRIHVPEFRDVSHLGLPTLRVPVSATEIVFFGADGELFAAPLELATGEFLRLEF